MAAPTLTLNVRADVNALARQLGALGSDQIPFVTAYALTKTAQAIKADAVDGMQKAFDRPTRYTLNALAVQPATKTELRSRVDFRKSTGLPASRPLGPEVEGGHRAHKSFEKRLVGAGLMLASEYAMPGGSVPLDAYGNVSRAYITRVLATLGVQHGRPSKSKRGQGRPGQYLVLRGEGRAPPGVYERAGRGIRPIFIFTRAPHYQPRFAFYELARAALRRDFATHFREGWRRYGAGRKAA